MRPIRRILVAVKDLESQSSPAVDKAVQLAHAFKAELHLFHSITTALYFDAYTTDIVQIERAARAHALERLEARAAAIRRHHPVVVSVSAEWDFPAHEAIIRRASRYGADLIIAQRHAGKHHLPGLLQLTDWELLRLSPLPVLLVKSDTPYHRPVVLAAVDPGHTFAKPVGLDKEILGASSAFAQTLKGQLHAVHAFVPLQLGDLPSGALVDVIGEMQAQARREAGKAFDKLLRPVKLPASRRHLVPRHPIDAIQEVAGNTHSAIVVMGAISRSGLARLIVGNTAESLLDHLECDVLIVKPRHFRHRVPRGRRGVRKIILAAA